MRVDSGELLQESGEPLLVSRFIVRQEEVAFDLVADAEEGGDFSFTGIAKRARQGVFISQVIEGKQAVGRFEQNTSVPCRFMFEIRKISSRQLVLTGNWVGGGDSESFDGTLKVFATRKRQAKFK